MGNSFLFPILLLSIIFSSCNKDELKDLKKELHIYGQPISDRHYKLTFEDEFDGRSTPTIDQEWNPQCYEGPPLCAFNTSATKSPLTACPETGSGLHKLNRCVWSVTSHNNGMVKDAFDPATGGNYFHPTMVSIENDPDYPAYETLTIKSKWNDVYPDIPYKILSGSLTTRSYLGHEGYRVHPGTRVEAQIRLGWARGSWPAFWMCGNEYIKEGDEGSWPFQGELDMLEAYGSQIGAIEATLHGAPLLQKTLHLSKIFRKYLPEIYEYHTYAAEYEADRVSFFLGEIHLGTVHNQDLLDYKDPTTEKTSPYPIQIPNSEMMIWLNLSVRPDGVPKVWPSQELYTNPATEFSRTMRINYVRVYQKCDPALDTNCQTFPGHD